MCKINHETILKNGRYRVSIDGIDTGLMLELYKFMLCLRRLQEMIVENYRPENQMRCPVHFCIGQEAVPAAVSCVIGKDDFVFGPHRSHGYYLAKNGSISALLAELYGRKDGTNGGKAGSQEISFPAHNFYSGAILSGLLAIAVGVGLGFRLKNKSNIAVVGLGDGAVDEGIFWEAINYAQLCKLPVVFICENNRYSTYSHQLKRQVGDDIHNRVKAFGVKTKALFGNDVITLALTLSEAAEYARKGQGPVFIEAYTYRWKGHVGPEDDDYVGYRPESEINFWKNNCPILLLEEEMFKNNILTLETKKELLSVINNEIAGAFEFAKNNPFPDAVDWESQNYSGESPLADKLLRDGAELWKFDQNQAETIPEPY